MHCLSLILWIWLISDGFYSCVRYLAFRLACMAYEDILVTLQREKKNYPLSQFSLHWKSSEGSLVVFQVGVGSKSPSGLALPSGSPADPQAEQSLPADAAAPQEEEVVKLHILDLPNEIFEKIFSYLTYKNIGEIRRVRMGCNCSLTVTVVLGNFCLLFQSFRNKLSGWLLLVFIYQSELLLFLYKLLSYLSLLIFFHLLVLHSVKWCALI